MATLTADKARTYGATEGPHDYKPVAANTTIFRGSAVGNASGLSRPLQAGDEFNGFAWSKADNSAGSAGDEVVEVRPEGLAQLDVAGVGSADVVNDPVYASDDDTFTLTSSGNSAIGKIVERISGTRCWVYFQATSRRSI